MIKTLIHTFEEILDGTRDKEVNNEILSINKTYKVFATQTNTIKDKDEVLITTIYY